MKALFLFRPKAREPFCRWKNAFTLVEVVLSLGIFSFAILSIMGLMVTGLSTVKNSSTNQAITNINRELRATIQATAYTDLVVGSSTNYYFMDNGYQTTSLSTAPSASFYKVVMNPTIPTYPTGSTSANALSVSAVIWYPYPANTQAVTNSYFVAQ